MKITINIKSDYPRKIDIYLAIRHQFKKELSIARESYETFKNEVSYPALKDEWKNHLYCAKFYKQILSQL